MTSKKLDEIKTKLSPAYRYEEMLEKEKPEYEWPMIDEKSAAFAQYTSGTTGDPKEVYLSHRAIYLFSQMYVAGNALTPSDCILQTHPMFHVVGCMMAHAATYARAKYVLPGRWEARDPKPLVDLITNDRVTWWCTATAVNLAILRYLQTLPKEKLPDWSYLRFINGATEPPVEMVDGFKELVNARCIHNN